MMGQVDPAQVKEALKGYFKVRVREDGISTYNDVYIAYDAMEVFYVFPDRVEIKSIYGSTLILFKDGRYKIVRGGGFKA